MTELANSNLSLWRIVRVLVTYSTVFSNPLFTFKKSNNLGTVLQKDIFD